MGEIYFHSSSLHDCHSLPHFFLGGGSTIGRQLSYRINKYSTVVERRDQYRVEESIIHHTYYSWWYLVFFTAPVMGSVLDLDINSYKENKKKT